MALDWIQARKIQFLRSKLNAIKNSWNSYKNIWNAKLTLSQKSHVRFLQGQYSWNLLWSQKCESKSIFPPFLFKKKSPYENHFKNYKSVSSHQAVGSPLLIFPWSQTWTDKETSLVVIQVTQITPSWKQIYCFFCCRHKLHFYSNMSYWCHLRSSSTLLLLLFITILPLLFLLCWQNHSYELSYELNQRNGDIKAWTSSLQW